MHVTYTANYVCYAMVFVFSLWYEVGYDNTPHFIWQLVKALWSVYDIVEMSLTLPTRLRVVLG